MVRYAICLLLAGCVGGLDNTPFEGSATGSITGRLTGTIDPIRAFVSILGAPVVTASVAADGSFQIDGIARGPHRLYAFNGTDGSALTDVEVFGARTVTAPITLLPEASIAGRVTWEHGFPAQAPAHLGVEEVPLEAESDAHGRFEIAGLFEGCWHVLATSAGFAPSRALICVHGGERAEQLFRLRDGSVHAGALCAPCSAADQCAGALCVTAGQEQHCSQACNANHPCPAAFACLEVEPGVHACALPHASCTALEDFGAQAGCADDASCGIDGVDDAICDGAMRCTLACPAASCPEGSTCIDGACH